jgi:hypothetical protein
MAADVIVLKEWKQKKEESQRLDYRKRVCDRLVKYAESLNWDEDEKKEDD